MKRLGLVILMLLLVGCNNAPVNESTDPVSAVAEIPESEKIEINEEVKDLIRVKVTVDVLNIREQPTVESEKLGNVYKYSVYEVIETNTFTVDDKEETWYKVHVGKETEGWIAGWFCEETKKELNDKSIATIPKLNIENMYKINEMIIKENMVTSRYSLDVYVNNVLIGDSYTFDKSGIYEIEVITYDELMRVLCTDSFEIEVFYDIYGFGYSKPNGTRILAIKYKEYLKLHESSVDIDSNHVVWQQGIIEDQVVFVNTDELYIDKFNNIKQINVKYSDTETLSLLLNNASFNKFMVEEGFLRILDDNTQIVNLKTGKLITLQNTVEISPDHKYILNYRVYSGLLNGPLIKDAELQLIEIGEEEFKVIHKNTNNYGGFQRIEFNSNKIVVEGYLQSENHWKFAPENLKKEIIEFTRVNDEWLSITMSSDILEVGFVDEMLVYKEINENSELLGVYDTEDVPETNYLATYDIIDEEIVLWFEVTLADGRKGYAYRTWRDNESGSVLRNRDIIFILDNGTTRIIESLDEFWYVPLNISDALSSLGYYTTSIKFDEHEINVYDSRDGSIVEIPFNSEIELSPDKTKILAVTSHYGEPETTIRIYNIENKTLEEIYIHVFSEFSTYQYKWIDNDIISFTKGSSAGRFQETITNMNGEWILSTDE